MDKLECELWTSKLEITCEIPNDKDFKELEFRNKIQHYANLLERDFDWRTPISNIAIATKNSVIVISRLLNYREVTLKCAEQADKFSNYKFRHRLKSPHKDCTGFLKGLMISCISYELEQYECPTYTINFGGDILTKGNTNILLNIRNVGIYPYAINKKYCAIFTSDNTSEERGKHIIGSKLGSDCCVCILEKDKISSTDLITLDMTATKVVSNRFTIIPKGIKCHKFNRRNCAKHLYR